MLSNLVTSSPNTVIRYNCTILQDNSYILGAKLLMKGGWTFTTDITWQLFLDHQDRLHQGINPRLFHTHPNRSKCHCDGPRVVQMVEWFLVVKQWSFEIGNLEAWHGGWTTYCSPRGAFQAAKQQCWCLCIRDAVGCRRPWLPCNNRTTPSSSRMSTSRQRCWGGFLNSNNTWCSSQWVSHHPSRLLHRCNRVRCCSSSCSNTRTSRRRSWGGFPTLVPTARHLTQLLFGKMFIPRRRRFRQVFASSTSQNDWNDQVSSNKKCKNAQQPSRGKHHPACETPSRWRWQRHWRKGDGLQLRVLLKWHICFFMRRICDVVSTYIHIVYRYSIFFPYDGMARRWRASLSIVLKSLFALHKSASSRCAMYLKFKHITWVLTWALSWVLETASLARQLTRSVTVCEHKSVKFRLAAVGSQVQRAPPCRHGRTDTLVWLRLICSCYSYQKKLHYYQQLHSG